MAVALTSTLAWRPTKLNRPRLPRFGCGVPSQRLLKSRDWVSMPDASFMVGTNAAQKAAAMGTLFRKPRRSQLALASSAAPLPPADAVDP
eukprot:1474258-Amphidinium_carterae.1